MPGFARRRADESGVHREPPDLGWLLGTALVGAGAIVLARRWALREPAERHSAAAA